MPRENGEVADGALWSETEAPVPLGSHSQSTALVEPASNGDRAASSLPRRHHESEPSADDFAAERMLRTPARRPDSGWRRALFHLSAGHVCVAPSAAELRHRELVARVKTPIRGCRKIAFISRKGGVGKTSTCLLAGHTFAAHRGDRVIALDGNPDAGTLGHRVRRETTETVTSLLADAGEIERYADIRAYTSQSATRLEVVAADDDPQITQAIGEDEFKRAIRLLERHYNLVCLDTGTGVLESATRGILDVADQVVVVIAPSLDAARAASSTLDWLVGERLPAPRRRRGRSHQRRSPVQRRRRSRPNRVAFRGALPRHRADPVGLASGDRRRDRRRGASGRDPSRLSGARRRRRDGLRRSPRKEVIAMQVLFTTLLAATPLGGDPNSDGLPGSQALQQLVGGLAFWGLLAALAGLIISAAVWALSAHGGNYHHAGMGKRGTLISAGAALLIGAAPAIVAFFEDLGNTVS